MPSGDPQRVWFAEMIEMLRQEWRDSLSWDEMIALRDRVDNMYRQLRVDRKIRPPTMRCPVCGHYGPAGPHAVSVRAMILALGRFGIVDAAVAKDLEKCWKAHAKARGLDRNGRPRSPPDPAGFTPPVEP